MGTAQPIRFSAEDIFDTPDDGNRYEVIDGRLYVTPPPLYRHQEIVTRATRRVGSWVHENRYGVWLQSPCGVVLDDGTGVQPDAFFVSAERLPGLRHEKGIYGAPDLVVEVLSPSTSRRDRVFKRNAYATSGVREYWIVSPEAETVLVLALSGAMYEELGSFSGDRKLVSRVFPELPFAAQDFFED